jgi:hypothetical protein
MRLKVSGNTSCNEGTAVDEQHLLKLDTVVFSA